MIDLSREPLITFPQAAKLLPAGRRPAYATWYRWWKKGLKSGIKLETVFVLGRRLTTEAAVRRFIDALSSSPDQSKATSPKSREYDVRLAEKTLAEWGV